ncbi:MAG: antibiotic biosynthesis monooxygenase [Caldilineaceae bacterium]|jgi:quinol monooxygenase YgiN|nr:antibiotic biosynthesis monooxygenase [Caldilineaceae bacterium]
MATGLVVHLEIAPGRRADFVEIARAHAERSVRLEQGRCLSFEVFVPQESETLVILVEKYVDDAALQAHWESAHMADYNTRVDALIIGRSRYRCRV